MLAPDVILHRDDGGRRSRFREPLARRHPVMRLLIGLLRPGRILGASLRLALLPLAHTPIRAGVPAFHEHGRTPLPRRARRSMTSSGLPQTAAAWRRS